MCVCWSEVAVLTACLMCQCTEEPPGSCSLVSAPISLLFFSNPSSSSPAFSFLLLSHLLLCAPAGLLGERCYYFFSITIWL